MSNDSLKAALGKSLNRMTVKELLKQGSISLEKAGLENASKESKYVLAEVLKKDIAYLIIHEDSTTTEKDEKLFFSYIARRSKKEPLSKIIQKRSFYKYDFTISQDTLDPRPDSEVLIKAALEGRDKKTPYRVLDLGAGSGCLLISILKELHQAKGVGIDISVEALKIAEKNAKSLNVMNRMQLLKSNWLDCLPKNQVFDIVISNPPYIKVEEIQRLDAAVKLYDPYVALEGGVDGLAPYKILSQTLFNYMHNKTEVFFEIGAGQEEEILYIMGQEQYVCRGKFYDLGGHVRCLKFTRNTP